MRLCILGSGSGGNAFVIEAGGTQVIVDAGLPEAELSARAQAVGIRLEASKAILLTHEHRDHVIGLRGLAKATGLPVMATADTLSAYQRVHGWMGDEEAAARAYFIRRQGVPLPFGGFFDLGAMEVGYFGVPHDAAGPVGYTFSYGGVRLGLITDLGRMDRPTTLALRGVDMLFIESNHCPDLLGAYPGYPPFLKTRIASDKGHLSNTALAEWLRTPGAGGAGFDGKAALIGLLHLSARTNTPELAHDTARAALEARGGQMPQLHVASQHEPSGWLALD